jgi:hypothetical protein
MMMGVLEGVGRLEKSMDAGVMTRFDGQTVVDAAPFVVVTKQQQFHCFDPVLRHEKREGFVFE